MVSCVTWAAAQSKPAVAVKRSIKADTTTYYGLTEQEMRDVIANQAELDTLRKLMPKLLTASGYHVGYRDAVLREVDGFAKRRYFLGIGLPKRKRALRAAIVNIP